MGCGKSTKAKQLANRLDCAVVDLDAEIVSKSGKSIADYFLELGESKFRQLETETLKSFSYSETSVVATGGGLPCFLITWLGCRQTEQQFICKWSLPN